MIEELIKGIMFGIGFAIVSAIGDYLKAKFKRKRTRSKKVPILKLVRNR